MFMKPFTLLVKLSVAGSTQHSRCKVEMPKGLYNHNEVEALIEAVDTAAKAFWDHLLIETGADPKTIDSDDFLIEAISQVPADGETVKRYAVDGCYSDYPEGGAWSDSVMAVSPDDAELQARYIMACNEDNTGSPISVMDFTCGGAATWKNVTINAAWEEPVTKDEAIALLRKMMQAGTGMLKAFGNCGSPYQQEAANALASAINEAKEAGNGIL